MNWKNAKKKNHQEPPSKWYTYIVVKENGEYYGVHAEDGKPYFGSGRNYAFKQDRLVSFYRLGEFTDRLDAYLAEYALVGEEWLRNPNSYNIATGGLQAISLVRVDALKSRGIFLGGHYKLEQVPREIPDSKIDFMISKSLNQILHDNKLYTIYYKQIKEGAYIVNGERETNMATAILQKDWGAKAFLDEVKYETTT